MNIDTLSVKQRVRLTDLMESDLGPPIKISKCNYSWPCVFHEDHTPSLVGRSDKGLWHCFGCNASGDHYTWLMKFRRMSFLEAHRFLQNMTLCVPTVPTPKAAIPQEERQNVLNPPHWEAQTAIAVVEECAANLWRPQAHQALEWLYRRGLHDATLKLFRIGYNAVDCTRHSLWIPGGILIPRFINEQLWSIKVRRPQKQIGGPKYMWVAKGGSPKTLYGLNVFADKAIAVICEGELDAMLLWQEVGDLVDVVGLGSAGTHPDATTLLPLASARRWWIALDRDQAGQRNAQWWESLSARVRITPPLQGNDVTEFYQAGGNLRAWITSLLAQEGGELCCQR